MSDFADTDRLVMLKHVLVLGLVWGLISTRGCWLPERLCPKAPLAIGFQGIPENKILYTILLILLVLVGVVPNPVLPIFAWTAWVSLLCLGDWTRMRPWIYQHGFMLMALAGYYLGALSLVESLNVCRLVLVCVYFWAGLLKLNLVFFRVVYPWIVGPLVGRLPGWGGRLLTALGYAAPWLEASLALGLLFSGWRGLALWGAALMHALILLCFSPLGHRNYGCIWPWNLSMLLSCLVLFWGAESVSASEIVFGSSNFHRLVLGLFGALPALGLGNWLDPVVCHGHMCGRHVFAILGLSKRVHSKLPKALQKYCVRTGWGKGPIFALDLSSWYLAELRVPPPQQERLLRHIARDFERYGADEQDLNLTVFRMPGFFSPTYPIKVYSGPELFSDSSGSMVPC